MKPLHLRVALRLITTVAILSACSKPTDLSVTAAHAASPLPASENAALRYWEAWWEIGPKGFASYFDRPRLVDVETGEPVDQSEPQPLSEDGIEMLIAATEMSRCDFGKAFKDFLVDDPERSPSVDHVVLLGMSFNLLLADAKSKMQLEQTRSASRSLAAALRLVDHTAQQPLLLVFGSPASSVVEIATVIEDSNVQFADGDRAAIALAVAQFDSDDPFRIARSLHSEMHAYASFLKEMGPDADTDLDPEALVRLADAAVDFMESDETELEAIWIRLELSDDNPTRRGFEPLITNLRSLEMRASKSLDWLRDWSSQ